MSRKWKITAAVLLIAGVIICAVSLATLGFDFKKLNTVKYTTNTYELTESFSNITIDTDTADVIFKLSEDGTCKVECHEDEKEPHHVRAEGDTLRIGKDSKSIWQFLTFNFGFWTDTPSVTVYLPETEYKALSVDASTGDVDIPADFSFESIQVKLSTGDVRCKASAAGDITIRTSTGSIRLSDVSAGNVSLTASTGGIHAENVKCEGRVETKVSTGKTTLENITCESFASDGDTGDLSLKRVIVSGEMNIERDTGDVKFDRCDAETIVVETDTGDVTGTLLTEKVFITKTDTGSVDVPKSVTGGRCEISTDTGDIRIEIRE